MTKKILLLAIAIMVGYNLSFSQTPAVDSLRRLLEAHPQRDTTRVNLLNKLAIEVRRVDRKQMQPLTDEALQLAEQLGSVSYTHLRAHETPEHLVCRLLLE